jgi:Dolichyl-phosphate-mannose-protein mannosyltransferase
MHSRLSIRQTVGAASREHLLAAYLLVALALAYFAVMATRQIALPGLNVDEVLGVRPALGGPVARRILGIPVLNISYIGALKSYIYFPIFTLFGASAETIRLPTIIISLLTLIVAFKLARLHFRPLYGALLVLLMAFEPIFILMSKADYGPIVLMMFFKMLVLYFFFRFVQTWSPRYLWGVAICCGLGLFDKFNFIWFVVALLVAALIVYRGELRSAVAKSRAQFIWLIGAVLVLLAATARYSVPLFLQTQGPRATSASSSATDHPLGRINFVWRLYLNTMNSKYEWFLPSDFHPVGTIVNWITLPILGLVILAAAARLIHRQSLLARLIDRTGVFYLLIFTVIFGQIVLTTAADGPHHLMMLYPFHYILVLCVANRLSDLAVARRRTDPAAGRARPPESRGGRLGFASLPRRFAVVLGIISVAAVLVASEVDVGVRYERAIDDRAFNHFWTPAIYDLAAYLNRPESRDRADAVITANWGIYDQTFVLSRPSDRSKYADLWSDFTSLERPEQGKRLVKQFFAGKRVLVVAYVVRSDKGAAVAREHFLSFAKYYFGGAKRERLITNDRGEPIYGVYYVDARRPLSLKIR